MLEPLHELAPELVSADMLASVADQPVQQVEGSVRATWREAVEAHDLDALAGALAPDVKLRSPITKRIPFEGRERVLELMEEIFAILESMEVVRDIRDGDVQILEIETRLAGYDMHQVQVIELDRRRSRAPHHAVHAPAAGCREPRRGDWTASRAPPPRTGRGRARRRPLMRLAALLLKISDRLGPRFV